MMIRICKHYIPWNLAFLVIAEGVMVFGSVYVGAIIRRLLDFHPILTSEDYVYSKALVVAIASSIAFYIVELYDDRLRIRSSELFIKILMCLFIIFFIVASINFLIPSLNLHGVDYLCSLMVFVPVI